MTTRMKLQRKEKPNPVFNTGLDVFYSGFALTDNKNFAEFYINDTPDYLTPKLFKFKEKDLIFEFDHEASFLDNDKFIMLDSYFLLDKRFYMYFNDKYKAIKIYRLKSWLGKPTDRKFGVVDWSSRKLVGLLLTEKK